MFCPDDSVKGCRNFCSCQVQPGLFHIGFFSDQHGMGSGQLRFFDQQRRWFIIFSSAIAVDFTPLILSSLRLRLEDL